MALVRRTNRWWGADRAIDPSVAAMHPRDYLPLVLGLLSEVGVRRAVVLLGPRRVGKTILIQHVIQKLIASGRAPTQIGYLAVDHPLLHGQSLESLVQWIERAAGDSGGGPRFLFFDEIQYLKDWERHLKTLVDARPELRILVSGSAAAALKRQSIESGAGRFTDFLLPPLTFHEFVRLSGNEGAMRRTARDQYDVPDLSRLNRLFVEYVNFGGYPELALNEAVRADPDRFVRSDIVDKVLLRDLPTLYGIQDIQELNLLFTQLAYNSGEEISLEALSQRSGVAKQTISRYIQYLEAAFLVRRIFRIDQSARRLLRERSFKVYLTNPSMRTGLFGARTADESDFGHLVETAIYAQRFHEHARLHYARWRDAEIDMIELNPALRPVAATECKWSDRIAEHPTELAGLTAFCRRNGLEGAWVTTRTVNRSQPIDGILVRFVPAAVLAFHLGLAAVEGRIATFEVTIGLGA